MRFFPRQSGRRAVLAALLACFAITPVLTGCAEDRSNLIPKETSDSLISKLNKVQELAANGDCFSAIKVAESLRGEVDAMGGDIDTRLKRSLVDGVNQLQGFVSDPEKCTESDTTTEEPLVTEETPVEPEGTTGDTGTTDTGTTTTGDQGTTTDDEQNPTQNQPNGTGTGNGATTPPSSNPTTPTSPTTPSNPTTPETPSNGPGSGGLGPG